MSERLLGICGSRAESKRTRALIEHALEMARMLEPSVETSVLDLRDTEVAMCDGRAPDQYDVATQGALRVIAEADMYVVGSPIYRGSYTGALKNLFDLIPAIPGNDPLRGKPVGLIATGGSDHHFLVIEHQVRPLMGFFGMWTAPTGVYVRSNQFDQGRLADPKVEEALRCMVGEILGLRRAAERDLPAQART